MHNFLQTMLFSFLFISVICPGISLAAEKKAPITAVANPRVLIETNYGDITVELFQDKAPVSVANFLRYVDDGFYEDTLFHRVIRDFMIQAGGYTMDYQKKPTHKAIRNEANNGLQNMAGTLAMARTNDPHSATAQFFINVVDNTRLDFIAETPNDWGYCVFGKVISGMEIAIEISQAMTGPAGPFDRDAPQGMILIEKISRLATESKPVATKKPVPQNSPSENKKEATP